MNPVWGVFAGSAARPEQYPTKGIRPVWATASPCSSLPITHTEWLQIDLAWVEMADAVLRLPGESKGADMEEEHATDNMIPVFYNMEELMSWAYPNRQSG